MRALPALCCLLLLAGTVPAALAGPLYKWKDANGVTQYSERPPTGQAYETRHIATTGVQAPAEAETPADAVSPQCASARQNLELLAGDRPVMQDTDGDGKPDTPLDDTQRAAHRQLAEAAVAVHCTT
ncbi:DUF4124 domain-containing protein [Stenotrophomonas mori]|uniref:DUF4124 domain-containing protein n=1 Tax=Stenotrophomonas mori TaxID=2871096 RepID=A0ABT0SKD3_9GAMM|nr:DUF4124 domain-containing protein [Stenotrophomonas mori]MCL7715543.1 DUF4124 domain-containing protein [Stenotrophomonas mori]